ncbi:hypothetical protein FD09_GL001760 [Schleiferilactobacillus perolens DSM 12744]|uniref:Uncharacterized protein n=1 Tax=Schleiferilactobacillus perolens DSM 12744 TaxID=1423792 RepID=A0A0R1N7A0_9LACO|nr:hypothetical protein FD09_GL001760 [Schleiferilactobacillus perolens DSM 12744]
MLAGILHEVFFLMHILGGFGPGHPLTEQDPVLFDLGKETTCIAFFWKGEGDVMTMLVKLSQSEHEITCFLLRK